MDFFTTSTIARSSIIAAMVVAAPFQDAGARTAAGVEESISSPEAEPGRWIHVGGSPNHHEEYVDSQSIGREGHKASVWTRQEIGPDQGIIWYERELDCSTKMESILAYVKDDGGTVTHNPDRPHRESSPIVPGSVEERILDIACR